MYLVKRSDTKSGRAVTWNDKFDQFAQAEGLGGADSQCTYISGTNTEFIQDNTLELVNAPLKATIL